MERNQKATSPSTPARFKRALLGGAGESIDLREGQQHKLAAATVSQTGQESATVPSANGGMSVPAMESNPSGKGSAHTTKMQGTVNHCQAEGSSWHGSRFWRAMFYGLVDFVSLCILLAACIFAVGLWDAIAYFFRGTP